jgi:hypothetical protein
MKMMRFWGEVVVGVGVCSKAVRRGVCLMLESSYVEGTEELNMEASKLNNIAGKLDAEKLSKDVVREQVQIAS